MCLGRRVTPQIESRECMAWAHLVDEKEKMHISGSLNLLTQTKCSFPAHLAEKTHRVQKSCLLCEKGGGGACGLFIYPMKKSSVFANQADKKGGLQLLHAPIMRAACLMQTYSMKRVECTNCKW